MAYGMLGVLMPVLAEVQLEPMPLSYGFFFWFLMYESAHTPFS